MPPRRNLLIAFDAFGTLFRPRRPIAQQYGEVARALGMTGFRDEDVEREFRSAFKKQSKMYPNYGKAHGMNATKWWKNIIENTFSPLVGPDPRILEELAPRLLYRFATEEGYIMCPGVFTLLRSLSKVSRSAEGRIVVGVVTNSDDRVPDILTSLGLRVSPVRHGQKLIKETPTHEVYDIDFSVMSYDVGHEKPDKRIFTAAEKVLWTSPQATDTDPASWDMLYVGDDYDKDVIGAVDAGWNAVLISGEPRTNSGNVEWLDGRAPDQLGNVFQEFKAVGFSDLSQLSDWLIKSH